jgi:hypothetical protein
MNENWIVDRIFHCIDNIPRDTHDEYLSKLDKYKEIIDKTPHRFLDFHLNDSIVNERYELAQYIKDKMNKLP